jgi:UDP-N-acetylmuramoylalanine--D-glutamate ligase
MVEIFGGRSALVCGVGLAGASAARALLGRGTRVLLADRSPGAAVVELCSQGAVFAGDLTVVPDGVDLVVPSPGWRPDHPLLLDAIARELEVLGELELAWRLRETDAPPWLAVTGTNGKTPTVRMLEAILRADGADARAVGNVGVSVIDAVVGEHRYDVLAVECSSFQLHWSSSFAPAAAAWVNLAPDHLDWHGSMREYAAAKARIWRGPVAIGNADDPAVSALLAVSDASTRVGFTCSEPVPGQLGCRGGAIVDHAFCDAPTSLVPTADIRPPGAHNVANALAAAALARAHGVTAGAVAEGLRDFVPDPHRNELVLERAGVRWVDDSKATNPHAARASLLAYRPVVWVAGGQLKDAPVDDLVAEIAGRLRGVVLLGTDRERIAAALRRHASDVPVIDVSTGDDRAMIEVVRAAAGLSRSGDTVLLAPAGASYDMFSGYAARGDAFAGAARALDER